VAIPKTAPTNGGKTFKAPVDALLLPQGSEKSETWKILAGQASELGGKLRIEAVKDDKLLSVRVNGASLFEIAPAPLPGQVGGVGFVPDSSAILLNEVLIEGKLDSEWHQTAATERARAAAEEVVK